MKLRMCAVGSLPVFAFFFKQGRGGGVLDVDRGGARSERLGERKERAPKHNNNRDTRGRADETHLRERERRVQEKSFQLIKQREEQTPSKGCKKDL